jgi:putative sterol carrier protein
MAGLADRNAAKGVRETYQYRVGRSAFYFTVDDGSIQAHDGEAEHPAVVVTTDEDTWANLVSGNTTTATATATGALTITGDPQAAQRLRNIFRRKHMLAQAEATT